MLNFEIDKVDYQNNNQNISRSVTHILVIESEGPFS